MAGTPHDIKPNWLNIARKCQMTFHAEQGFSVVQVKILVGPGGEPVFWFEPEVNKIEPLRGASVFLHTVLERMVE